ncbi:hypothetical protein F5144DRAFT_560744 [Chaetomium tenue]|uniref:Uncharacterized protein n=1 Tax=Chaetomium tenue TaxID=1854479 RepID=A0ACB7PIJ8_9PEZI|nr:hypothetical protein F5144DRAFT_560744 [Chaetomium globosum]
MRDWFCLTWRAWMTTARCLLSRLALAVRCDLILAEPSATSFGPGVFGWKWRLVKRKLAFPPCSRLSLAARLKKRRHGPFTLFRY